MHPEFVEFPELVTVLPVDVLLVFEPKEELLVVVDVGSLFVMNLSCNDLCVGADGGVAIDQ